MNLTDPAREFLLTLARRSIRAGLRADAPGAAELAGAPPEALAHRACFVTLTSGDAELRGCRGILEARQALAVEVWDTAWASAFDDPRFTPVTAAEVHELRIEISVLGPLQPVVAMDERELCRVLVPGRDGVVLAWRGRRATFLPQVWEDVPEPSQFLAHLKAKAGLPADFWAPDVVVSRYAVEKIRDRSRQSAAIVAG